MEDCSTLVSIVGGTHQSAGTENFVPIRDGNRPYHRHETKLPLEDCPSNLRIVIVGAGIGGLSAAIGLRRNGHEVHVCHRPPLSNQTLKVIVVLTGL